MWDYTPIVKVICKLPAGIWYSDTSLILKAQNLCLFPNSLAQTHCIQFFTVFL